MVVYPTVWEYGSAATSAPASGKRAGTPLGSEPRYGVPLSTRPAVPAGLNATLAGADFPGAEGVRVSVLWILS